MQITSNEFDKSIKQSNRNRGYIKTTIGVVNSDAQRNAVPTSDNNNFTNYTNIHNPFEGYSVNKNYATAEEDFSKLDGTRYFLPKDGNYYNNGLVTENILGSIHISFGSLTGLDIKGLTIDFGDCYPVDFTIENDSIVRSYSDNNNGKFVTEDVFDRTSYIIISPTKMINGNGRLRIHKMSFGILNSFTNVETLNFTLKEFVSPVSETLPSMDVMLTVDNQDQYFSPDNPESTLAYFEIGQELKVSFGYDVDGQGNIEWLPENTSYLKEWSATDTTATFIATDRFERLTEKYYKGIFRPSGITLYDLAVDVLTDAGVVDEREYYLDPYLKDVIVYNPIPPVTHAEALQIIANAGRCVLFEDRLSRIHMKTSFVPEMTIYANNEAEYSNISNILNSSAKNAYANSSKNFTLLNDSILFKPKNGRFLNVGYVSESVWRAPEENALVNRLPFRFGNDNKGVGTFGFWEGVVPKITIDLEAGFSPYGILIIFRNVAPKEFVITTYYQNQEVESFVVENQELEYITDRRFELFDKMEIEFTKGCSNSRLFVDSILIGDVTNYLLSRDDSLTSSPVAKRQNKIKSINVRRLLFSKDNLSKKDVVTEEIVADSNNFEHTVYFTNATTDLEVSVTENPNITATIIDSSNYFATISFSGISGNHADIKFTVSGYEYLQNEQWYIKKHNDIGVIKEWNNPIINSSKHASDIEEWLSTHLLGDVEYDIAWRGDPRTDANDLFYLELKDREKVLIRCYQNEIRFNGAWSGTMKARRAVVSWD